MEVAVAHSPDTDDHFLFWAIRQNRIDTRGLNFNFVTRETAGLNQAALAAAFDIVAISAALYPRIQDKYFILSHGASIGRNYGPVLVGREKIPLEEIAGLRIAVPGLSTTACAVLQILCPQAKTVHIPMEPFQLMLDALEKEEVDALLLIHEGQITYRERGLSLITDLGRWWREETQLPLPLGLNVIRRELGEEKIRLISSVLKESIAYALDHQEETLDRLYEIGNKRGMTLGSPERLSTYLAMYANYDSLELDEDCKRSLSFLYQKMGQEPKSPLIFV